MGYSCQYVAQKSVNLDKGHCVELAPEHLSVTLIREKEEVGDDTKEEYKLGEIYVLKTPKIEGVEISNKLYFRLYAIVDSYNGVSLNSLILREGIIDENGVFIEGTSGSNRRRFSIPPVMCKSLGIEYEPGYELWPNTYNFEKFLVEDVKPMQFNADDLSTYPTSKVDGSIRAMRLLLHGFSSFNNTHIITPTGAKLETERFLESLAVQVKDPISTDNGCCGYDKDEGIPFTVIIRKGENNRASHICGADHNLCLELHLTKPSYNIKTQDGVIGVSNTSFRGKSVNDVFMIRWSEKTADDSVGKKPQKYYDDLLRRMADRAYSNAHRNMLHTQRNTGYPLGFVDDTFFSATLERLEKSFDNLSKTLDDMKF